MAAAAGVGAGMDASGNGSAGHRVKDSYWAQDSQGGDIVYTTDTLLRCVLRGVRVLID